MAETNIPENNHVPDEKPESPEMADLFGEAPDDEDALAETVSLGRTTPIKALAATRPTPEAGEQVIPSARESIDELFPQAAIHAAQVVEPPRDKTPLAEAPLPPDNVEEPSEEAPIGEQLLPPADQPAPVDMPVHPPRLRLPSLVVGGLLIALGVIFVWPAFSGGYILVPGVILAIIALGVALSLLAHWLYSGRRARGTLFLALVGLSWGMLTGIYFLDPTSGDVRSTWPLYIVALGFATLLTFLGDRRRDRRLITPGFVLTVAGLTALLTTTSQLPDTLLNLARQGWPIVLGGLVLGLLPMAIRRVPSGNRQR